MNRLRMRVLFLCIPAALCVALAGCQNLLVSGDAGGGAAASGGSVPSSGSVQYYFPRDGQAPAPVLISLMNSAKSTLDVAIYSFTDSDISDAVIAAKERGVAVRVITDSVSASNATQKKVLAALVAAGIPVKENKHSGLMHLKVTIVDGTVCTTGSFNYTKQAEKSNDEVFVVMYDATAAKDFDAQFQRMWDDTKGFVDY